MNIDENDWVEFRVGYELGAEAARRVAGGERPPAFVMFSNGVPDREDLEASNGARELGRRLGYAEERIRRPR